MSDIDLAVSNSKKLESLLEKKLGASGRGLHEKVSSVESKLPRELVRQLRLVATVRNKVVHDADYGRIDNRKDFVQASKEAERALKAMGGGDGGGSGKWVAVIIVVMIVVGVLAAARFLHH